MLQLAATEKEKKNHQRGDYLQVNYSKRNDYQNDIEFLQLYALRYNASFPNLFWDIFNAGLQKYKQAMVDKFNSDKDTPKPKRSHNIVANLRPPVKNLWEIPLKDVGKIIDSIKKEKISYEQASHLITVCKMITVELENTPSFCRFNHLIKSKRDTRKVETRVTRFKNKVVEVLKKDIIIPVKNIITMKQTEEEVYEEEYNEEEVKELIEKDPSSSFFSMPSEQEQISFEEQEREYQQEIKRARNQLMGFEFDSSFYETELKN